MPSTKIPKSIEEFMEIYEAYEDSFKDEEKTYLSVDILQNYAYSDNPITPFHEHYYLSKFKVKNHKIYTIFFILSIFFFILHFTGYYLVLNLMGVEVMEKFVFRTLFVIGISAYSVFFSILLSKNTTKWKWKTVATVFPLTIVFAFSVINFIGGDQNSPESFLSAIFMSAGIAFGPACLSIFLIYKIFPSITDFGGISLFLGWIYRISETNGSLDAVNSSFNNLLSDLDNWLNDTSQLSIKNKNKLLEGFYFKVISNENFLNNISVEYKDLFSQIMQGLIVEDILHLKSFSDIIEEKKKISELDRDSLNYLKNRLSLTQMPQIISIIEKLTSKKVEIMYYTLTNKFIKFKAKIVSFMIFILSTLIPLLISVIE